MRPTPRSLAQRHPSRPGWLGEGSEPDYRFTLANERTFLAWVRTALALIAGAIAVVQLVPPFAIPGADIAIGVTLALLALAISLSSYLRWRANEQAIRQSAPLPYAHGLVLVAATMSVVGAAIALLLALELA